MTSRFPLLLCTLSAIAVALGGCGSTTHRDERIALRLAQPGGTWDQLAPDAQQEVLAACRLDEAVAAARGDGATSAPYRSGRYAEVMSIPGQRLHRRLDRWFRDGAHAGQTIDEGCSAVVSGLADVAALRRAPAADFASPVRVSRYALRLAVDGESVRLRARVAPAGARLAISSAPGRARTTARWTVRQVGDEAAVDLRDLPRGVSYLEARVGSWRRLIVVHQAPARRRPVPRTFAPIVLRGQGRVGLPVLYVPQHARMRARVNGTPLSLASGRTLLLALGAGDRGTSVPLRPGRYRDVQVRAPGAWSITIVPAS